MTILANLIGLEAAVTLVFVGAPLLLVFGLAAAFAPKDIV